MSKSIAVFGAGPAMGRAVAHRYARDGYSVVAVARRSEPLDALTDELRATGASAYAIAADLTRVEELPEVAKRIRSIVGDPDVLYYGAAAGAFIPVTELTPQRVEELMPLGVYAPMTLAREFLPAMIARGDGAILSVQGASAVIGMARISGGLVLAAQRHYLQALHAAVADKGVYVGGLYVGAAIERSAFHDRQLADRAAGRPVPDMPTVDPDHLANLLRTMHTTRGPMDATYPDGLLDDRP